MNVKVERRKSKIHGNGVFAIADIKKGELIMEYRGRLITHDAADDHYSTEMETGHTFLFILNKEWVIDAGVDGNDARWINTSCDPNGEAFVHEHKGKDRRKDKVIIEARRNIRAGDEITYDYGIRLGHVPSREEQEAWVCHCGSARCRGTMLRWRKPSSKRSAARPRRAA